MLLAGAGHALAQTGGGEDPAFTRVYAYVNNTDSKVAVFATPQDAVNNTNPVREMDGYEWVTVISTSQVNTATLAQIKPNEWVSADRLVFYKPSKFQGRTFDQPVTQPVAWVLDSFQPTSEPGGDINPDAPVYRRYDTVTIFEKALVDETLWYRIGDNQWCRQQHLAIVTPRRPPPAIKLRDRLHGKWISVNLFEQTIAAYEGEQLVYATLISSGLPKWETVKGVFQIESKNKNQPMYNAAGDPDLGQYHLEDVPYNQFFYTDYALHGAYWHDGFGFKHSRGCVNLSLQDARWFWNWTQPAPSQYGYAQADADHPGTWVWVH